MNQQTIIVNQPPTYSCPVCRRKGGTVYEEYPTALAIRGMKKEQRELFEWYLYKYHKSSNIFGFSRVTDEEINFHVAK